MNRRGTLLGTCLLYLAFVVYGSLVPFEYRPHDLDQALRAFTQIPWLDLEAGSRADWIANLVLYIPLAFMGSALLVANRPSAAARHVLTLVNLLLCLALALVLEFGQIFFAPRTVSLNDLLAETIGSLIGIALWTLGRHKLTHLWHAFAAGGRKSLAAAIVGYAVLYLGLALFPFDFMVSGAEISEKIRQGQSTWLLLDTGTSPLRAGAGLLSEIVAIAPLGMLLGLLAGRVSLIRSFALGLITGLVLEALQFLLLSGITQGVSILARAAGLTAGTWLGSQARIHGLLPLAHWTKRLTLPALPLYLLALLAAAGWFSQPLLSTEQAVAGLKQVSLIPFYYHYYTSEPVAMASLLANLGMYAPLGILTWARQATIPRSRRGGLWQPVFWAVLLALPIELSKSWLGDSHPDFTNLLIGASGAMFSHLLANWLAQASAHADGTPDDSPPASCHSIKAAPISAPVTRRPAGCRLVALVPFALLLVGIWHYPLAAPLAAMLAFGYGLLLWRLPWAWLFLLPALLPVLDLAPHTGRLLLDELDLLLLVTLSIGYWRLMAAPAQPWLTTNLRWASMLLLASGLLATGLGLWPLLDNPTLSIDHSHSPLESVMVAKGLFWALLLLPLLRRIPPDELVQARQWLIAGLAAGLALLSLTVLWERQRFVGLTDFDSVFRVTGNFSSMNNGGAYIEAFIAIAFPALVVWILRLTHPVLRWIGLALAALASYTMLVTFSRGGYAGLAAGLVMVVFGVWRSRHEPSRHRGLVLAGVLVGMIAVAAPILLGGFAQGRLAQVRQDLLVRLDHWRGAIDLMEPGIQPVLIGMGFGSYPALYLWQAEVDRPPGTFAIRHELDNAFLRLGAGDAYYLDQIIEIDPSEPYTLHVRIRFHGDLETLQVPLCEKALLYSFHCNWHQFRRPPELPPDQWHELVIPLQTAGLDQTGRWPVPTLKLSLAAPSGGGAVDIDQLSLRDAQGRERLANGGFEQGLSHWLSATDRDLAWHIHQTPLEVYFAQGLLGLSALLISLLAAGRALLPGLRRGEPFAIALGGGLAGFLIVGLLGSTLDTARLSMLFYLLCFSALLIDRKTAVPS